jgi:hypothetical protein
VHLCRHHASSFSCRVFFYGIVILDLS